MLMVECGIGFMMTDNLRLALPLGYLTLRRAASAVAIAAALAAGDE
jgi:hypothetical protein